VRRTALKQQPLEPVGGCELQPREFALLRQLVLRHTGIALAESKRELVKRRFAPRLRALGLDSFGAYAEYLQRHYTSEGTHFCNAITTNLTAFFRENHHFDFLRARVLPPLVHKARARGRVRLWSAGCSTGQEAYCMALTVLEALPDAHRYDVRILATDLDEACLASARAGAYPLAEFAKVPPGSLKAYFEVGQVRLKHGVREGYVAGERLKRLISFKPLNLVEPWPMAGPFDVIFCRNVFIYFDKSTQQKLLQGFAALQKPGGILCLGHSETMANPAAIGYRLVGKTTYERQ